MLPFSLRNPYALSLDPNGPFPVLGRLLSTKCIPTADIDLSCFANKTILITGVTSGCGLRCAKAFARIGCRLILTARDRSKGEAAVRKISEEPGTISPTTRFVILELDMTAPTSICDFKAKLEKEEYLDIAILNAGVYRTDCATCPETQMEETIQVRS
jgi:short-subunit dehydrogenase